MEAVAILTSGTSSVLATDVKSETGGPGVRPLRVQSVKTLPPDRPVRRHILSRHQAPPRPRSPSSSRSYPEPVTRVRLRGPRGVLRAAAHSHQAVEVGTEQTIRTAASPHYFMGERPIGIAVCAAFGIRQGQHEVKPPPRRFDSVTTLFGPEWFARVRSLVACRLEAANTPLGRQAGVPVA